MIGEEKIPRKFMIMFFIIILSIIDCTIFSLYYIILKSLSFSMSQIVKNL